MTTEAHVERRRPWHAARWPFWLLVAALATALALCLLGPWGCLFCVPNVEDQARGAADRAGLLAIVQTELRELEAEIGRYRTRLEGDVCLLTDREAVKPVAQIDPAAPVTAAAPALADGGAPTPAFSGSLQELLDQSTVLVLAQTGKPGSMSQGSGFVVAPGWIVTNDHVVGEGHGGVVQVVNRALGGTRSARVAAQTHAGDGVGQRDYALLEVEGGTGSIPSLSLRTQPQRLEAVIAAGYPGLIVKQDEAFKRLIRGDPEAVPALILRSGEILVTQALPSGAQVVAHTAQVLHGNSGGPLTDRCGRAVGVVTFARFEADGTRGVDYAFSGADLVPFLQQNGVRPSISDGPCPAEPAKQPASAESSAAPTENSGG